MRITPLLTALALAAALAAGCAPARSAPGATSSEVPTPYSATPVAAFASGIGQVDHLEARSGRILAAHYQDAAVALFDANGTVRFKLDFPGLMITSVKLAPGGDRVFVALLAPDMTGDASALWLDQDGTVLWERTEDLGGAMYDANLADDGRALALYALPSGYGSTGLPAIEVIDDLGMTTWASPPAGEAVSSVRSSADLSRHLVTMSRQTDPHDEQPPDTTIDRYENAALVSTTQTAGVSTSVYLSASGDAVLTVADGTGLSLVSWESTAPSWEKQGDFVSHAVIAEDGSCLLAAGFRSVQTNDSVVYVVDLALRDMRTGDVLWSGSRQGASGFWPSADAALRRIALVPWSPADDALLYERADDAWTTWRLPDATTAACFAEDGALLLGAANGNVTRY